MDTDTALDATFAALAHPVRRAIVQRLGKGAATVNELAEPFDMSLPAISRHLKVLEKAGLVDRGKAAQSRPRTLNPAPLQQVESWTRQYRAIWEARFANLDEQLRQMKEDDA